ncbi:sigma 54-interacting transcriptional regulator [Variovorax sp. J22P240]|uniref:sigma 54-interacting transcriptional regulator n=1 Tax=Variovorax sp. J22P240 TaxID=3053514 RepID=UPI00257509A4|nr:sigma 54-interacting transcriptional regulator [Variovorax sp. J22P240]MDM0001823.1 sigma 54-interacting transcriptional regulator [Variovorax sp. J22P240]
MGAPRPGGQARRLHSPCCVFPSPGDFHTMSHAQPAAGAVDYFHPSKPHRCADGAVPNWTALNLIGESPAFREVLKQLQRWAAVDATVLLCGETGTGKELAARAVHYCSKRGAGPFVPVNCGAIPDNLVESELFGHAKGAFTDAKAESRGLAGQAEGGTLFLDEIDSLSPRAQAAILRFVQDHTYRPVGGSRFQHGDVRLIAATNADLATMTSTGRFRRDLLFRLDLLTLRLPPLRERSGDALLLAETFVRRLGAQYRMPGRELSAASRSSLQSPHPWAGNVRELEHHVHRCFLMCEGPFIDLDLSGASGGHPAAQGNDASAGVSFAAAKARAIAEFERSYVRDMLTQTHGNVSEAARLAGKERSRFGRLIKKHNLQRAAFGEAGEIPFSELTPH